MSHADSDVVRLEDLDPVQTKDARNVLVSEIFYSIEGEGPMTGRPTLFVRTFGCNFTCSGFSNPNDESVQIVSEATSIAEAKTDMGCDSIYSWHAAYRHLAQSMSVVDMRNNIMSTLSQRLDSSIDMEDVCSSIVLSLTGGEPMLHQKFWATFLNEKWSVPLAEVETILIETNGSVPLHASFKEAMQGLPEHCTVVFSVSPKLGNSGEPARKAIRPDVIASYMQAAENAQLYLKFVTDGSFSSIEEILGVINTYNTFFENSGYTDCIIYPNDVWLMPEGATLEQQKATQLTVAEAALRYGFNYCARAHVWLWGNTVGT